MTTTKDYINIIEEPMQRFNLSNIITNNIFGIFDVFLHIVCILCIFVLLNLLKLKNYTN